MIPPATIWFHPDVYGEITSILDELSVSQPDYQRLFLSCLQARLNLVAEHPEHPQSLEQLPAVRVTPLDAPFHDRYRILYTVIDDRLLVLGCGSQPTA